MTLKSYIIESLFSMKSSVIMPLIKIRIYSCAHARNFDVRQTAVGCLFITDLSPDQRLKNPLAGVLDNKHGLE